MASDNLPNFDLFEAEFLKTPKHTIDDGYSEIAQILLDDIVHLPQRTRSIAGEWVSECLKNSTSRI